MARAFRTPTYQGDPIAIADFARLKKCNRKTVYRYLKNHNDLEGWDEWRTNFPQKVDYKGERLTFNEVAERLGIRADSARRYYYRHGTLDGCGEPHTDMPWLQRFYKTLDPTIPLDRCIASAGYRSIRQFCKDNDLSDSLVGCWRRGKLSMYAGNLNYLPPEYRRPTLLDEMTNFKHGISIPLYKIMMGTGCLEWELFPDIFTQDYYNAVYKGLQGDSYTETYEDTTIERNERRRAIRAVLRTLPDRMREMVELTFGVGLTEEVLTYEEIGKRYRLTRERVRQLLCKAIRILRSPSRMRKLREVCPFLTFSERTRPLKDIMGSIRRMKGLAY